MLGRAGPRGPGQGAPAGLALATESTLNTHTHTKTKQGDPLPPLSFRGAERAADLQGERAAEASEDARAHGAVRLRGGAAASPGPQDQLQGQSYAPLSSSPTPL